MWETKEDGATLKFHAEQGTCWRKVAEPNSTEHGPSLPGVADPGTKEPEWFFDWFFPQSWWHNSVIPAWSASLRRRRCRPTSVGEANRWRGMWRIMSLNPQYKRDDFWDNTRLRTKFWNPFDFSTYMSKKRFKQLTSAFTLRMGDPPSYRDRFWNIREMIGAFNAHMQVVFAACWAVCLDESMVKWLNEFAPGWMAVGRKPSPFGNEYHTMACALLHIIFWIEIVEGKDRPPQLGPLQHVQAHGLLGGLILRAADTIKGSNRCIGMDSGFQSLPALAELRKRGLHGSMVMKKKRYWAKGFPGEKILEALRGEPVGTTKVLRGKCKGERMWCGCQVDSKHSTLIVQTYGMTDRTGKPKTRKVGGRKVSFQYCSYQNVWYWIRHAVDDNNHNRMHPLPLEDAVNTNSWEMRQFFFIGALCEVNAKNAYNYWYMKAKNLPLLTNVAFRRVVAQQLLENTTWQLELDNGQSTIGSPDSVSVEGEVQQCKLCHYPKGTGEWDKKKREYKRPSQPYQKYLCQYNKACRNKSRTFCACSPHVTICPTCMPDHMIDCRSASV